MDLKGLSNKYSDTSFSASLTLRPTFLDRPVKYANESNYLICELN